MKASHWGSEECLVNCLRPQISDCYDKRQIGTGINPSARTVVLNAESRVDLARRQSHGLAGPGSSYGSRDGASDERVQDSRKQRSLTNTRSPGALVWYSLSIQAVLAIQRPGGPGCCPPSESGSSLKEHTEHQDVEPSRVSGGMKNGAAVVENSLALPQEVRRRVTV